MSVKGGYLGNRKRAYRKKRYYGKRANTTAQKADKALRMVKKMRTLYNPELKHYDESNSMNVTSNGNVLSIVRGISQSTSDQSFIGNQIYLKKVNIHIKANLNASATASSLRFVIIQDKRPQSSVPAFTDVYTSASTLSFLNIDNQDNRFKVLANEFLTLSLYSDDEAYIIRNINTNFKIRFDDSAVPVQNDILCVAISDEPINYVACSVFTRLRYYDN